MTDREKAIVMAYTGVCMLTGTKFAIFHKYVEDIMGRPVQTIEMGIESVCDEIKEKARPDFINLCEEEQKPYVTPHPKSGYISIDDALSAFNDFMCNDIDVEGTAVFLELLKDRIERSEQE